MEMLSDVMEDRSMTRRLMNAAFLAAFVVLATGCSTYSGQKLGLKPEKDANGAVVMKEVIPEGIPYNMVRPEYALTRAAPAAGATKPTYSLTVSYVPDPSQRYSLKIKPSTFTNPDFVMKFGGGGTLQSTAATFTEQVTPTITAVGSFAANLVGVLATGLLDKASVRDQIKVVLQPPAPPPPQPPPPGTCVGPSNVPRIPSESGRTIASEIIARMNEFKDDATFAAQFHYVTDQEKRCLAEVLTLLTTKAESTAATAIKDWETARTAHLTALPNDGPFVDRITAAVKTEDTKELDAIAAEIRKKLVGLTLPEPENTRNALLAKARPAATAFSTTEARKQLDAIVNADAPTWRARHLLYLEREIGRIGLLRIQRAPLGGDPAVDAHLEMLRLSRAVILEAKDLHRRAIVLSAFIDAIRDKAVEGGTAPATAEFATARAELDAVLVQIETRRSRVIADAAPPTPPVVVPLQDQPVKRVTAEDVKKSKEAGWASGAGVNASEYVLVLKEVQ